MKKILIYLFVAALLVFSIWLLSMSIDALKVFVLYCLPDEMAVSLRSNWITFYQICGCAALSTGGIVFSSVLFIKQLLKGKTRKKMQDLQEKLQKESAE